MNDRYVELDIDDDQAEELKDEILTVHHPLGNCVFEYSNDRYNPDLYQLLFNWHPDHLHESPGIRPSIVLGRRGSGKSSYLNNLAHKENVISVPVKSWDIVDLVESQVKTILQNQDDIDSEKIAEIWNLVFLTLATRKILDVMPENNSVEELVRCLPIKDFAKKSLTLIASNILDTLRDKYLKHTSSCFDMSTITQAMGLGVDTLSAWETMLSNLAKKNGKTIILLIDNPERLEQTINNEWEHSYREASKPRWQAYSGLLCLLAHFNEGKVGIQARYCVSAEQYFFLQRRSSAILKDFSNIQVLHWSSGDLLSTIAHRYMVYLQLNPEKRNEKRYKFLKTLPIYNRDGAFEFFNCVFENTVTNNRGFQENTTAYLLRHTQLLPRQILLYINGAMQRALLAGESDLSYLRADYLYKSVQDNEQLCATEIIDSYRATFPEGKDLMESIDGLPIVSDILSIKTDWTKLGAKKILKKYEMFPEVIVEADRFIRFLIEVGILGRANVSNTNEGGYINAEFEYTLPQKLSINSDEEVVIHPIFACFTNQGTHDRISPYLGIYPKGTGIDEEVDRNAIRNRYIRS